MFVQLHIIPHMFMYLVKDKMAEKTFCQSLASSDDEKEEKNGMMFSKTEEGKREGWIAL